LPVVMMPIFGVRPPDVMIWLSLLARTKASMASRLKSCRRASWPRKVSVSRMFRPPGGIVKSVGVTICTRSSEPSTMPVDSTVSCMHLSADHAPVNRDIAHPY
jgi:hypothetical protein